MPENISYGCLTVLGTNGQRKKSDIDPRQKSCFILNQRPKGNGIKMVRANPLMNGMSPYNKLDLNLNLNSNSEISLASNHKRIMKDLNLPSKMIINNNNGISTINRTHSITYTLNRDKSIKVQYEEDPNTDLFQVGRSTESVIDMVIIDDELDDRGTLLPSDVDKLNCSSTISRFACRLSADRRFPYHVRLFAGGFDEKHQISLGQHAPKINRNTSQNFCPENSKNSSPIPTKQVPINGKLPSEIDGLTTNGVLIKKPGQDWLEVSVNGYCHKLRETRSSMKAGNKVFQKSNHSNNNILVDNTLIDLCGCMLLYRDANYVKQLKDRKESINLMVDKFNNERPQCPVRMQTLRINPNHQTIRRIGKNNAEKLNEQLRQLKAEATWPFVYLGCGHIHSYHDWDMNKQKKNGSVIEQNGSNGRNSQPSSSFISRFTQQLANPTGNNNNSTSTSNSTDRDRDRDRDKQKQKEKEKQLTEMRCRTCPICRQESRFSQIKLGFEPAFLKKSDTRVWPNSTALPLHEEIEEDLIKFDELDVNGNSTSNTNSIADQNTKLPEEELTHVFNPCGHMTTEATALYWSEKEFVLQGTTKKHHVCPFCLVVLDEEHKIQRLYINNEE